MFDDLQSFAWKIGKDDRMNIGAGTLLPKTIHQCWKATKSFFIQRNRIPENLVPLMERIKGTANFSFQPEYLDTCQRDGAFLIGDALGLAHPFTSEGIFLVAIQLAPSTSSILIWCNWVNAS